MFNHCDFIDLAPSNYCPQAQCPFMMSLIMMNCRVWWLHIAIDCFISSIIQTPFLCPAQLCLVLPPLVFFPDTDQRTALVTTIPRTLLSRFLDLSDRIHVLTFMDYYSLKQWTTWTCCLTANGRPGIPRFSRFGWEHLHTCFLFIVVDDAQVPKGEDKHLSYIHPLRSPICKARRHGC